MARKFINNRIGYFFNLPLRIAGFLLVTIGIVVAFSGGWGPLFAVLLILVGAFFSFTLSGVMINTKEKSIKQYTKVLGFKKGNYRDYPSYPFITIIPKKVDGDMKWEVHLLSKSHRGKTLLGMFSDEITAQDEARDLAGIFEVDVVEYAKKG